MEITKEFLKEIYDLWQNACIKHPNSPGCDTCKYETLRAYDIPCVNCRYYTLSGSTVSYWEPKEDV